MSTRAAAQISVVDHLVAASRDRWSGELVFHAGERMIGLAVLHRGRIAWAVSSARHEDLGTFLWQLGRVTKEQLAEVRMKHQEHQGRRKLGALLEEAGYITRPVLRQCLMLHTRMALTALGRKTQVSCTQKAGNFKVDQEMTFGLEEVLPELASLTVGRRRQPTHDTDGKRAYVFDRDDLFGALVSLDGFRAAALVTADGVVQASKSTSEMVDVSALSVMVASMMNTAALVATVGHLDSVLYMVIDCESGSVVARWLTDERRILFLVVIGSEGRLEEAQYQLNEESAEIVLRITLESVPAPVDYDDD
jgi:predicted regulator of Ras-like GTPase activity (Roadblock/LC7/MglB family)